MKIIGKILIYILQMSILFTFWLYASELIVNGLLYIGISKSIVDGVAVGLGVVLGMNWMTICDKSVELYKKYKPW